MASSSKSNNDNEEWGSDWASESSDDSVTVGRSEGAGEEGGEGHAVTFQGDGLSVLRAAFHASSESSGSASVRGVLTLGTAQLESDVRNQGKEDKEDFPPKADGIESAGAGDVDMVARCKNCGREGHCLMQCARAGPGGPIAICPLCEDDGHCIDECSKWEDMSELARLEVLVYSRACKPRWKTASLEWDAVLQSTKEPTGFRFPWTDEFAVHAMVAYRANIERYEATLCEALLPRDPKTETLEKAINHFNEVRPLVFPPEIAEMAVGYLTEDLIGIESEDE